VLSACAGEPAGEGPGTEAVRDVGMPDSAGGAVDAYLRPTAEGGVLVQGDTVAGLPSWTREDWEVVRRTVAWAWERGIDTLPVGERIARVGLTFVGTPYIPQTLDPPGPERLVINVRALDCVTYVENMMALAHFVRMADRDVLSQPEAAMRLYQDLLTRIRYRDGRPAGYSSRLHYFSDWIGDNAAKGLVEDVTAELGGVIDGEPIRFMTSHRDAYRQLADPATFAAIESIEERLRATPRHFIPEERVRSVADRIRDGDIIAATSTLAGLDVAHTGIALWQAGALYLMNAPLVGRSVEVSDERLPDRLIRIGTQDGLMVARPLEPVPGP